MHVEDDGRNVVVGVHEHMDVVVYLLDAVRVGQSQGVVGSHWCVEANPMCDAPVPQGILVELLSEKVQSVGARSSVGLVTNRVNERQERMWALMGI